MNWLKLIGMGLLGTIIIVGINEYFFAPRPSAAALKVADAKKDTKPEKVEETSEDWEAVLDKKRKEKESEERRKLAAEKLFENLGAAPATPAKTPSQANAAFAAGQTAGGGGKTGGGGSGGSDGGGGSSGGGGTSGGGGGGTPAGAATPAGSENPEPTPTDEDPNSGGDYWVDESGLRHNSNCRFYKNVVGQPGGPEDGNPDPECGG